MKMLFALLLFVIPEVNASTLNCITTPGSDIRNIYRRNLSAEFNRSKGSPLNLIQIFREKTGQLESSREGLARQAMFTSNDPLKADFILFEVTGQQTGTYNSYYLAIPKMKPPGSFKAYLDIQFDFGHSGWSRQPLDCTLK